MAGECGVRVRRIYDEPAPEDGARVLVDRVWPRGMTKQKAQLDEWCKQVAPSTDLRKWYGHQPERFEEFTRRYRDELTDPERAQAVLHLRACVGERADADAAHSNQGCWYQRSRGARHADGLSRGHPQGDRVLAVPRTRSATRVQ